MRLVASCHLDFTITHDTPFMLMLRPRSGLNQWIAREEYRLYPTVPVFEFTDTYGNLCQRMTGPVGEFSIRTSAEVVTSDFIDRAPGAPFFEIQNLPDDVLSYLLPSRYCESDRCHDLAVSIAGDALPGYDQVAAIERWLRETIVYRPGESVFPISALEVYNRGSGGVCRDLSHLGIALCRGLSIPARMVVGYLHGLVPMDLHAWFEAYVGGRWYTFDATQTQLRGGYIAIGYGRDAADVAIYTLFGQAAFPQSHVITVERIDLG